MLAQHRLPAPRPEAGMPAIQHGTNGRDRPLGPVRHQQIMARAGPYASF